jgi:aspartate aminotransferase-like enzyme
MEAGIRLLPPGPVLALVNGAFSERWAQIAEACGHEVERRVVDWGRAHDEVGDTSGFVAVLAAHNETSTGVVQPIEKIARAVAPTPLLVDSTSGLGGAELKFDDWNLAYALTGSQKALALPPGLAFAVAREDLLEQASGSFYFDLRRYAKNPPPFTPALPQLYALAKQAERIEAEGVDARLARHYAMMERVWEWAEGRTILADRAHRSPTVTCILDDESDLLRARLSERGFTLANGYGKLKGKAFRIGHMGDQNIATLNALLDTIDA